MRSKIDVKMSQEFIKSTLEERSIDLETPLHCKYWHFVDSSDKIMRSFAI